MNCPFCLMELELHEHVYLKGMKIYLCNMVPRDKIWSVNFRIVHPDDQFKGE